MQICLSFFFPNVRCDVGTQCHAYGQTKATWIQWRPSRPTCSQATASTKYESDGCRLHRSALCVLCTSCVSYLNIHSQDTPIKKKEKYSHRRNIKDWDIRLSKSSFQQTISSSQLTTSKQTHSTFLSKKSITKPQKCNSHLPSSLPSPLLLHRPPPSRSAAASSMSPTSAPAASHTAPSACKHPFLSFFFGPQTNSPTSYSFTVIQPGTMETTGVECTALVSGNTDGTLPDIPQWGGSCINSSRRFWITREDDGLKFFVSQQVTPASNQTASHLLANDDLVMVSNTIGSTQSYKGATSFGLDYSS